MMSSASQEPERHQKTALDLIRTWRNHAFEAVYFAMEHSAELATHNLTHASASCPYVFIR